MVAVVGFALLGLMVTPVRKQVFLLVTITNVMHCMTPTAIMVQKAAVSRSKSPPLAVKNSCLWCPYLTLPKGRGCQPVVVHILDVWGGWSMSFVVF